MKRLIYILTVVAVLMQAVAPVLQAQQTIKLDNSRNGTTVRTCDAVFTDINPNANYLNNQDITMTFCPTGGSRRIVLEFEMFNLNEGDTMFIYEGTSVDDPPFYHTYLDEDSGYTRSVPYFIEKFLNGKGVYPRVSDTSGCVTVRFVSNDTLAGPGWKAKVTCEKLCQDFYVALDTTFSKWDSTNNGPTTRPVRYTFDTTWVDVTKNVSGGGTVADGRYDSTAVVLEDGGKQHFYRLDTAWFYAVDFCLGDSIQVVAAPEFRYNDQAYHQSPESCIYYWTWGDGSVDTINYDPRAPHKYEALSGYNLNLSIYDTSNGGCYARNALSSRVRVARNPIKTIVPLADLCSGKSEFISVGYSANSSVITEPIEFSKHERQVFDTRTFIPDGGAAGGGSQCYESEIIFTSFPPGATIQDASVVEDICINIEHSYLGDLGFQVSCPNGQFVTLKYNTHTNSTYLGVPDEHDGSPINDTTINGPGTGWNYCWSNQYLDNAQGVLIGSGSTNLTVPITTNVGNATAVDSSHYEEHTQFFQTPNQGLPQANGSGQTSVDLDGFSVLEGCPLNGLWTLQVCDNWGSDNGWVFSWWMDLGVGAMTDWSYQVPIDTVLWLGPYATPIDNVTGIIQPPLEAFGTFQYVFRLIDDYGCAWDANTELNVVRTPVVDLGEFEATCEGHPVTLDAGNEDAYAYMWEPTGDTTRTIEVTPGLNETGNLSFSVMVTNYNGTLYCYGFDSTKVLIYPAANAAFTTSEFPLEGCEPYSFGLESNSTNVEKYYWEVGDRTSELPNPEFTFPYGEYDVFLKVESKDGCQDSIRYTNFINVFKSPTADFGWEPAVPYASNPSVTIKNLSIPEDPNNQYRWEFQVNRNNISDVVTRFEYEPYFTWQPQAGQSVAGNYMIYLDAYTYNKAPSGNVYECHDTISKIITIINDNLIFPTAITPNGDGINEIFEIHNLIDGQAFPDNELAVYNRYGKRIYFVQDIRTEEDFWDPNKTNSPTGTYFYRFIGKGPIRNVEFKGSVEVLRD